MIDSIKQLLQQEAQAVPNITNAAIPRMIPKMPLKLR